MDNNSGYNYPDIYVRSPSEDSAAGNTERSIYSRRRTSFQQDSSDGEDDSGQSFGTAGSQRRQQPSTKNVGTSKKTNENLSVKGQNNHAHWGGQSGSSSPVIEETSFINRATEEQNFDELKEGLGFALGTSQSGANWFPVSSDSKANPDKSLNASSESLTQDLSSTTHDAYTDNIALDSLSARRYSNSTRDHKSVHLSPFNDPIQSYQTQYGPVTPTSEMGFSFNDSLNPDILESGRLSPSSGAPPSHSKISNALTRLSDRIAGNRAPTSPTATSSPSKSLSRLSVHEEGRSPASPLSRLSVFTGVPDSDSSSNRHGSENHSNINLPNVMVTDEFDNENYLQRENAPEGLGLFFNNDISTDALQKNTEQLHSPTLSPQKPILLQLSPLKLVSEAKPNNDYKTDMGNMYLFGKSLKLFSPKSKVRLLCHRILSHRLSNTFLLILLLLQTALLSYRQWNPIHMKGYYYGGNNLADYILILINVIYTFEVFGKIIAYGLLDDRVMFKELGLAYPKNEIKVLYFQKNYLIELLKGIGFSKFFAKNRKKSIPQPFRKSFDGNSSDDVNSEVAHIDEDEEGVEIPINHEHKIHNPFVDHSSHIQNKYSDLGHQYDASTNLLEEHDHDNENLNLVQEQIMDSQIPDTKNTFLLPRTKVRDIELLQLKRAFLRNSWQRIDFLSMLFFWISLFLSIDLYDLDHHINLFRALSCLRILRLCNLTTGTTTILTACKVAIPQLIDVSIFICCFWLFLGIIGVQSFKSSLSRQCVWFNPDDSNDTYIHEHQYCGSYIGLDGEVKPYIYRDGTHSSISKGFTCPKYSRCISGQNPYGGTVSFDNILQSMELVFVIMSANTFTDLMYYTMDSDNMAACLFFILTIFIMTVWLINVFVAVIVASFTITRKEADEEKKQKNKSSRWKIFSSINQDVSLHTERINMLKKKNALLKYYYRFEFIFIILIIASLFVQCFRSHSMPASRSHILYRFEASVTGILLLEIVIRFVFHFPNWRLFFISKRNCFDLFLAILTTIIIIGPVKEKLGHAYYWLTVFQLMRFYRVVLATKITRKLWLKIMGNFKAIFDLALFFFILTYLASIITARYFEGAIPESDIDDVDFPMHTLPNAFIALYVITSTENWTDVLYNLQEYATTTSSRAFGAMLLIGWFIISNMVILNVFIAVIAKTLEVSEEDKRRQQLIQFIDNMTERLQNLNQEPGRLTKMKDRVFGKRGVRHDLEKAVVNLLLSGTAVNDFLERDANEGELNEDTNELKNLPKSSWKRWFQVNFWRTASIFRNPFYAKRNKNTEITNFDPAHFAKNIISERNILISKQNKYLKENPKFNSVFYVMGPRHKLRRMCQRLVKSSYGERIDGVDPNKSVSEAFVIVMFTATIALVVTACYLTPLYRKSMVARHGFMNWTFYLEIAFIALFSMEFFIRITADGLIFTPNAYMRSSWNLIDMIVLISLWIEFIATMKNDGNLSRVVRGLKALRALRLLTISETAKNNFHNTIISGFWKIINAAIISLCLLFPFSIWGLNIFNGRLGVCLDGSSYQANCIHEYENQVFDWNVMSPNVYDNPLLEFDNFGSSFSALFQIVSLEGWVDLLLNVMKSTGVGTPTEDFATPFNGFFVVLFNFVSIVFILTLFVSVIISNYSKTTGRAYMTKDQISWYQVKKFLVQVKPSKRKDFNQLSMFQKFCYSMTVEKNTYWHKTLTFILLLHVIALLLECFPSYDGLDAFRALIFMIAALLFLVNALMLFIGQGAKTFVRYKWNVFNLVVSSGAFLTTIISFFVNSDNPFLNFNKLFLVGILTFIIPRSNRLSELLRFASASLPSLLSLSFTWTIVFLVFAIAMNQVFGLTKIGENTTGNINVRSVPKALILLFRCSFGEGWNYIMDDFALVQPYCSSVGGIDDSDCGNKQYAYILFMLWNVISMYIFLNMFVSLIVDSFSYINNRSTHSQLIKREEIRKFKRTWQKFDPEGSGYIKPYFLPKFLHSLDGALSFHFYSGSLEIPVLCRQWFKRNNPNDPYDISVNFKSIETTLSLMDVPKIRERRKAYERFMEEALINMELNGDPGISFTRILLQLPLYTSFEAGQCLNLIDFLERRLLVQKVEKRLHTKRVYETIAAYACRWKYVENRNHGVKDTDIDFGKELKRNSFLANENLGVNAPSIFVTDNDHGSVENFEEEDETFPLTKSSSIGDEEEGTTSGIYVPKSPLHIYNARNRSHNHGSPDKQSKSTTHPKLYIQIPTSNHKSFAKGSTPSSPIGDTINISPFLNSSTIDDDQLTNPNISLIDLSTLGETLEDTQWRDAFREVQSERKNENRKEGKEE